MASSLAANAYDFYVDGIYYRKTSDSTVEVTWKGNYYEDSYYRDTVVIPNIVTFLGTTYTVTAIGDKAFYLSWRIKSVSIPNSVTSIGNKAFQGCSILASVSIPNSVTSIGYDAFLGCHRLTSVNIPNSITSIGNSAFNSSGLTSITIPNSVTWIDDEAFGNCHSLDSVTIPNVAIGNNVFENCSICNFEIRLKDQSDFIKYVRRKDINKFIPNSNGYRCITIGGKKLTFVSIPETVDSIGAYAFFCCKDITGVTIPNSVTSIGGWAFFVTNIASVTIPNSVTSIGRQAFDGTNIKKVTLPDNITHLEGWEFPDSIDIYVNRGTYSLLAAWNNYYNYYYNIYQKGTNTELTPPTITVTDTTQTTATMEIHNKYPEYKYFYRWYGEEYENFEVKGDKYKIIGLDPDRPIPNLYVLKNDSDLDLYPESNLFYIPCGYSKPINVVFKLKKRTASSVSAIGSYIKGDANVVYREIVIGTKGIEGDSIDSLGIDPGKELSIVYNVYVKSDIDARNNKSINKIKYCKLYSSKTIDIKLEELELETRQPKVINSGNVIVQATSNLDEREPNAGFEWRRTDWTDDFASNTGNGYTYDGVMEGYIRNLNTNYLWKYRPYYESNSGNRYYGEWVGIDPSNTSYFEPTVHTYDNVNVNGNTAKVKGYAQRGTDNVTEQGFMYWKNNGASAKVDGANYAPSIPSDAQTVTVRTSSGNPIMETTLTGLDFNSGYSFVAFVTTTDGTFYGEEQTFTTGSDPTGIIEVEADEPQQHKYPAGIYDLNGRKLQQMQRGVNIVRFEDGTVKKILVK